MGAAWRCTVGVLCLLAGALGCRGQARATQGAGAQPAGEPWQVEDLGPFPADLVPLVVTRDGLHAAYYVTSGEKITVYVDGREIAHCVGVPEGLLALSPDGSRWSGVLVTSHTQATIFIDGEARADLVGALCFAYSASSRGLAYIGVKATGVGLVVNGREQVLDTPQVADLRFLPDGESVAYTVGKGGAGHFVIRGQAQPSFDEIVPGNLTFSADGLHWAYAARSGGAWVAMVDGVEVARFERLAQAPVLSRDGARWACAGLRDGKVALVTPDGPTTISGNMALGSLTLSDDGLHMAYIVGSGGGWGVVVDGRAEPAYTDIANARVVFSPDGAHHAYTEMTGGPLQPEAGKQAPRRVGARYAVVLDGRPGADYDFVSDNTPIFSPDSARIAYTAQRGEEPLVVVDQRESPTGTHSSGEALRFSPDSEHVAYATFDEEGCHIALDGQPGPAVELVVQGGPAWVSNDTVEYLALRGDRLLRVRQRLTKGRAGP